MEPRGRRPARGGEVGLGVFDWSAFVSVDDTVAVVPEPQCHRILKAAGLSVAAGELANDEATAMRIAESIGLPVVLKGISSEVTHRAKAGLIAVDLRSADEVGSAFRRLAARALELSIRLEGVYVQRMQRAEPNCSSPRFAMRNSGRWSAAVAAACSPSSSTTSSPNVRL